ncbi:DUF302 domain-containing protein [Halococcus saccharolyticus]|uniref:DUF302 domain-containing protein n=2 Tax=Halococcus saccharolyticus TaxID=62319 RepID=UPI003084108D
MTTLDHAANAASVGMELRPTTLLVFGNPNVGTPLMQASQTTGVDLPQKILVYEDENGRTNVVYNSPAYLAARHDITGQDERLGTIDSVLETLAGSDVNRPRTNPNALLGDGNGVVTVAGGESVDATVGRVQRTLESADGISVVTTLDHAANADSVGMELRPTTVVLFANPKLGTPLMQASQTTGIDLPQKLLVYEDENGAVRVGYNDPQYVAARHGITGQSERLATIENALRMIAIGQ